jgi:ribosomal protein L29
LKGKEIEFSLLDLVFFPVAVPVKGFVFFLEQIRVMVDKELYDENELRKKLLELEMEYELGSIGEEEYRQLRSTIAGRMRLIAKARQESEQGGGE